MEPRSFALAEGLVCAIYYKSGGNDSNSKGFSVNSSCVGLLQRFGVLTTVLLQIQLSCFKIAPACSTLLRGWHTETRVRAVTAAVHSPGFSIALCCVSWSDTAHAAGPEAGARSQLCWPPVRLVTPSRGRPCGLLHLRLLSLYLPGGCFFKQCDWS